MRIAVDARVIQDRYHGIARNAIELLSAMPEDLEIVVVHGTFPDERLSIHDLPKPIQRHLIRFDAPIASFREQLGWRQVLKRTNADVVLVPYHLATPWFSPIPIVAMIHDCIFESDWSFAPGSVVTHRLYKFVTRLALKRAAAVITPSEATRKSVREIYRIDIPSEHVVRHGVNPAFRKRTPKTAIKAARAQFGLANRYVLHVGVRRPHKNQVTLVRAFAGLTDLEPRTDLVLVGSPDTRFPDPVPSLVRELGLEKRVHLLEEVPETLLQPIYAGAAVFAFPSLSEGFGLPVLEAMAAGVPVVASTTPAVAEAAEDAAVLIPPLDVDQWEATLRSVLEDGVLADRLRRAGRKVAIRRTWTAAARDTLAVLKKTSAAFTPARRPPGKRWADAPTMAAAIGPAAKMSARQREVRYLLLALALLAAVAALLSRIVFGTDPTERVPTVLNAEWVAPGELLRGGQPEDIDFLNMRDVFGVTGIVNFRPASRIERHVVEGFRLKYLWLRLPPGGAPNNGQLAALVNFVRTNNERGGAVFMHDQSGLDQAPAVAVMLEMLRGTPAAQTNEAEQAADMSRKIFTEAQIDAINSLASRLNQPLYQPAGYRGADPGTDRYPDANTLRW